MIWIIVGMFVFGVLLSAVFSGSETGFYRVTRMRLVLDGMGGDFIAKCLLQLSNNPTLFVATTLIGNNLANYLTTLAIVLGSRQLLPDSPLAELLAPVLLAPFLFVYGELLPKNLFYQAPNRLLRRTGPLLLLCGALFAPVTAVLWALGRGLGWLVGETPARIQLALARKELVQVLDEGHEAGILSPAQRRLAQGLFAVANEPVTRFCVPVTRLAAVRRGSPTADVLRMARRHRAAAIPVEEVNGRQRRLIGYVRVVDLHLDRRETLEQVRPLLEISSSETHISALMFMQSEQETMARVVDDEGQTVGLLTARRLTEPLLRGD